MNQSNLDKIIEQESVRAYKNMKQYFDQIFCTTISDREDIRSQMLRLGSREPSSDDVRISISPEPFNSMSEHEGMNTQLISTQPLVAAASRRMTDSLVWSRMSECNNEQEWMNFLGTLRQAAASSSEYEGMNTQLTLGQALVAASHRMTDDRLSLFCSPFSDVLYNYASEQTRINSQEGTLRQAAASSRSLGDNIAVIGLIGAISASLYGILFQLADKMHGSFFSHHRGMVMISGASMVYAAYSGVFLCVIFFLATADPTKTYRKRMRFLLGTYFYAACCGPAVMLMAMIVPSFGYKVLAWAVLGALFTPVGLYIGGY